MLLAACAAVHVTPDCEVYAVIIGSPAIECEVPEPPPRVVVRWWAWESASPVPERELTRVKITGAPLSPSGATVLGALLAAVRAAFGIL